MQVGIHFKGADYDYRDKELANVYNANIVAGQPYRLIVKGNAQVFLYNDDLVSFCTKPEKLLAFN